MDDKKRKRKSTRKAKVSPNKKVTPKKDENLSLPELKQKYRDLKREEDLLDEEIRKLESDGVSTDLKPLMTALHDYNEMKDLTQMVLGYLANASHCTVAELHARYNLPTD